MNTTIKNKELLLTLGTSILTYLPQTPTGYVCLGYGTRADEGPLLVDVYDLRSTDLWATDYVRYFGSGWVGADDTRLYFITVDRMKKLIHDLLNPVVELEPGQVWSYVYYDRTYELVVGKIDRGNFDKDDMNWVLWNHDIYDPESSYMMMCESEQRVLQYLMDHKAVLKPE
jgi:hypothetical protein